jgi:hypothetical protein
VSAGSGDEPKNSVDRDRTATNLRVGPPERVKSEDGEQGGVWLLPKPGDDGEGEGYGREMEYEQVDRALVAEALHHHVPGGANGGHQLPHLQVKHRHCLPHRRATALKAREKRGVG